MIFKILREFELVVKVSCVALERLDGLVAEADQDEVDALELEHE